MANGSILPIYGEGVVGPTLGTTPRITSLLIKPVSAVCNLDCSYCFYLDRETDPYQALGKRAMQEETLERLIDSFLFYSYPNSVFAFQGGEPTLAGLPFFRRVVELQKERGRNGQNVSNAIQTNGMLVDEDWCALFREYRWLVGLSLDGPEEIHDLHRVNKAGHSTWKRVMESLRLMQREKVDFNVLCVLSKANVGRAKELYRFFTGLGVDNIQYIPLSEFDGDGNPLPYTITASEYGQFLCETFDLWWPQRRKIRIRTFDNIAEALAGQKPGSCTMHETCDSYVVVEYNGDIFPCDFFVEKDWRLGNIEIDSWAEIARKQRRYAFARKKALAHPECEVCEWQAMCHGGCPKSRYGMNRRFEDLDYFCEAYRMMFRKTVGPLGEDVKKILGREAVAPQFHSISPY
ncbi:MAG: anaerobic sulfatase maturase [Bryobacterales bacterium]|nr:anaerobic sulfatase maturase [Bryobacterales bacterium]